jgi:hypothetical protein
LAVGLATANVAAAVTPGQARHAKIINSSKATASSVIALDDKTVVVSADDRQPLGTLLAPRVKDATFATRHISVYADCNINGSVSYTGVAVGLPGNTWVDTSFSIPGDWSAGEQHLKTSGSGTVSASTFTTPSGAMYTNGTYKFSVHYGSTWLSSNLVYCGRGGDW